MAKRIIVVSDSHGDENSLREAFEQAARHGRIDIAVFLGDGIRDFDQVKSLTFMRDTVCYAVKGNNDWSSFEENEILFTVNGARFFACHGHTRQVKYGIERLWFAARERGASVALYGHTHCERIELEHDMHLINPGAVCERTKRRSAYAEIMVEENGFVVPELVKWES